jgi:hypothetical protein
MSEPEEDQRFMMIGGADGGIPGSKQFACLFCQAKTWLAPAGQNLVKTKKAIIVCLPCYLTNTELPVGETMVPEQSRKELVDIVGETVAEWCITEGVKTIQAAKRKPPEPWKV